GKANIGDDGGDRDMIFLAVFLQLLLDFEDRVFAVTHQDQLGGALPQELAAKLAADGAAATGDENAAVTDQLLDGSRIGVDGVAPQEVFDVHVAQLLDANRAVEQFVDAGDDLGFDAGRLADVEDFPDLLAGRRGHGDDDQIDVEIAHGRGDGLATAQDGHAVDPDVVLGRVVVDVANHVKAKLRIILRLTHDHRSRIAGAGDQDSLSRASIAGLFLQPAAERAGGHAHEQPGRGRDCEGQEKSDERGRAGNHIVGLGQDNDYPAGNIGDGG